MKLIVYRIKSVSAAVLTMFGAETRRKINAELSFMLSKFQPTYFSDLLNSKQLLFLGKYEKCAFRKCYFIFSLNTSRAQISALRFLWYLMLFQWINSKTSTHHLSSREMIVCAQNLGKTQIER
jgi:hypothetical protein